jgi:sec-independent protein translocase protein TatB
MFDIGFSELVLVAIVALLVVGPERLPGLARNVGMWVGRAKRFVNDVQADINRELQETEELKKLVEDQSDLREMHRMIGETVDETRRTVSTSADLSASATVTESAKSETLPAALTPPSDDTNASARPTSESVNEQAK